MRKQLTFLALIISAFSYGQTGGIHAFPFLDLTYNARSAALGRYYLTVEDDDVNLGVNNPALLNKEMHNTIGFNQALLAAGINHGMVAYANHLERWDVTGSAHIRYVAYGEMERTDVNGEVIGTFSAGDFIVGAGVGKKLNPRINIGANFNIIGSQLESFSSYGVSIDMAGSYLSEDELTALALLVRNAGYQLTTYTTSDRAPLPANAMFSASHDLEHAPFRLGVVVHHLNKWDLTYTDPNAEPTTDPLTGELVPVPTAGFAEKLARHFIFQAEMNVGNSVRLRAAFDYQRRREFLVPNRPGMAGFSFGVGLNFKRFSLDYGLLIFSNAGYNNLISLTTNLDKWRK